MLHAARLWRSPPETRSPFALWRVGPYATGVRSFLATVAASCLLAACGPASLTSVLPRTIGGSPVAYSELAASDLGPELPMFEPAIEAVGANLADARVAVGITADGSTLTAIRVPGADATRMIDATITSGGFHATARQTLLVGGKQTVVLTLPPTAAAPAYLYAFGDTLVVFTPTQASYADEVMRELP